MKKPSVLFLDNTSADNLALALAATRPSSLLDVKAIFVTGRAAHADPDASIEDRQEILSEYIRHRNAKRMSGFLQAAGRDVPVYLGMPIRHTRLRTVIPHKFHADERDYDIYGDGYGSPIAGSFRAGLRFLQEYEGEKLLVLAGGPLTELAFIRYMREDIEPKLGMMVVQAGDFGEGDSSNLIGGKGNSFNGACDPAALDDILFNYKDIIYILPSNITKQPELGFKTPDEIAALGVYHELVDIYRVHYENSAKKRGTSLYIHDLGLVILLKQLLQGAASDFPYRYEPVEIVDVPYEAPIGEAPDRRGTIVTRKVAKSNRFVVTEQDITQYHARVTEYLQS